MAKLEGNTLHLAQFILQGGFLVLLGRNPQYNPLSTKSSTNLDKAGSRALQFHKFLTYLHVLQASTDRNSCRHGYPECVMLSEPKFENSV